LSTVDEKKGKENQGIKGAVRENIPVFNEDLKTCIWGREEG